MVEPISDVDLDELRRLLVSERHPAFDDHNQSLGVSFGRLAALIARLDAAEAVLTASRLQTASELRDISRRIGPAATPEWVRGELEAVANRLEFWAGDAGRAFLEEKRAAAER